MEKLSVIFHVDEIHKLELALANTQNFINGYEGEKEVEVLLNHEAVRESVKNSEYEEEITKLIKQKVIFKVCENALRGYKIKKENLIENIQTVPAGVVELAIKQNKGYSYIKP